MISKHDSVANMNIISAFSTPSLQNAFRSKVSQIFISSSRMFGNRKSELIFTKKTLAIQSHGIEILLFERHLRICVKSMRHSRGFASSSCEHIFQKTVYTNVTMHRKQKMSVQMMFKTYVMAMNFVHRNETTKKWKSNKFLVSKFNRNLCRYVVSVDWSVVHLLTTAQEIRPPTRDRHARYTLYRVDPVARHPTNNIMNPSAAIDAPIATKIICTASIHSKRKWNTWSNMMMVNDAPRYMVKQNIPTPIKHMTVAIIVAYGIRVIHDLQQFPAIDSNKQRDMQ